MKLWAVALFCNLCIYRLQSLFFYHRILHIICPTPFGWIGGWAAVSVYEDQSSCSCAYNAYMTSQIINMDWITRWTTPSQRPLPVSGSGTEADISQRPQKSPKDLPHSHSLHLDLEVSARGRGQLKLSDFWCAEQLHSGMGPFGTTRYHTSYWYYLLLSQDALEHGLTPERDSVGHSLTPDR